MPSKSASQARLMAAAAHDAKFAKRVGVPQSVAQEFNAADKGTGIIKPKKKKQGLRIGSKSYGGKGFSRF